MVFVEQCLLFKLIDDYIGRTACQFKSAAKPFETLWQAATLFLFFVNLESKIDTTNMASMSAAVSTELLQIYLLPRGFDPK